MRVLTQEQLDARYQRVLDCLIDGEKEPFHRPLEGYAGATLYDKIGYKWADEENRLQDSFKKIIYPTPAQTKAYDQKAKALRADLVTQMNLVRRHDRNQKWAKRMRYIGVVACLSALVSLCGGVVSIPSSNKAPQKNPATIAMGTIFALSVMLSWGSAWEVGRLDRANRRIEKGLKKWHILTPAQKEKITNRELYSLHMGLSGFLETFQYT